MWNMSRFHLRARTFAVESYIWHGGNGNCEKCAYAAVQNEVNVLFHFQDLSVCSQRSTRFFSFLPFLFFGGPFYFTCLA